MREFIQIKSNHKSSISKFNTLSSVDGMVFLWLLFLSILVRYQSSLRVELQ